MFDGRDGSVDTATHCPSFLKPVLSLILCTSENERLITTLQRQQADSDTATISHAATATRPTPLLQRFSQSFRSLFPALHSSPAAAPPHLTASELHGSSSIVAPSTIVAALSTTESAVTNEWMDSGSPSLGLFTAIEGLLSAPSLHEPSLAHICPASADYPSMLWLLKPHRFPVPSCGFDTSPPTPSLLSVEWVDPYISRLQSSTAADSSPSKPRDRLKVADDAALSELVYAAMSSPLFSSPLPGRLMDECLLSHIRDRYSVSSRRALRALLDDSGLLSCLLSLRSLYLSYDGVLTSDLMSAIRELSASTAGTGGIARIQDIVNACAASASSTACCQWYKRHPIAVSSNDRTYSIFSLSLTTSALPALSASSAQASSFSALSALLQRLSFRCAVPWPLDGIVTADHVRQYDAVFHFILQLNCALHTLARLPALSSTRQSEAMAFSALPHPLSHAFYLLRAAVHHSVLVLHSYVLSQATGSAWDELLAAVSQPSSSSPSSSPSVVRSLHAAHSRYLNRVLLVCLLAPSMAAVMSAVQRLLAVVAAVEEVAGMVADYLHTGIDDWQPGQWHSASSQLVVDDDDESTLLRSAAVSVVDESVEAEQRAVRRQRRMALSGDEQDALRAEYDSHKDGLYARCQRRCEEVREEYQHTVVFLLMVLGKIVHAGAHTQRQRTPHTHALTTPPTLCHC